VIEPDLCAFSLEHGVRRDRGAVDNAPDARRRDRPSVDDMPNTADDAGARIPLESLAF
jgi:hypothetical protein